MRKIYIITVLILLGFYGNSQDTIRLRQIAREQGAIVTDRPPQAVYFQLGGSAPIASVNYDRRFSKKLNGLGFSVGLGYWRVSDFFSEDISLISVPFSLNYLIGRQTHFVEVAAGTTFLSAKTEDFSNDSEGGSGFIHHINLGYRHQPSKGGFFFRGGYSPMFFSEGSFQSFYLGFGHNF